MPLIFTKVAFGSERLIRLQSCLAVKVLKEESSQVWFHFNTLNNQKHINQMNYLLLVYPCRYLNFLFSS